MVSIDNLSTKTALGYSMSFVACVTVLLLLVSSIPLGNALEEWLLLRGGVSLSSFPSQNWE